MAKGFVIEKVQPGSLAERAGIKAGERLFKINGSNFYDLLDYHYQCSDNFIRLTVGKSDGSFREIDLEKDFGEDIGLCFHSPVIAPLRRCKNKCVFCFVDQQPPGLRPSLYVKDDDYRLSFFDGNYITLTNMGPLDLKRVIRRKLSPLYISIHATEPRVRRKMMRNVAAGDILGQLRQLAAAGLEIHGQVVICPGYNDGAVLEKTVGDLSQLYPSLKTLALVPVGITKYRQNLKEIRSISPAEALDIVEKYTGVQEQFCQNFGEPFVYLSDELYLLAGFPLPAHEHYGAYAQLENGVGLCRLFLNELETWRAEDKPVLKKKTRISLVTGKSAAPFLKLFAAELKEIKGLKTSLYVVENDFWGGNVSVAGLLTGKDLLAALKGKDLGDYLFIPAVMLKEGAELFLDDISLQYLARELKTDIRPVFKLKEIRYALAGRKGRRGGIVAE
jgi:putative radical SAM enzyme (TIGR03279 family)